MTSKPQDPFFKPIGDRVEETDRLPETAESGQAEVDEDAPVQTIESLCMRCGEEGVTRLLLTSIPYFKEVIVASFRCEHCGEQNNEIQAAGKIAEQGTLYTAKILNRGDLNRQVVKSSYATIIIPEFELTIPPKRGQLTTVEGLVRDVIADLSSDQPLRRIQDEPTYEKIEALLKKLHDSLGDDEEGEPVTHGPDGQQLPDDAPIPKSFTVKVDDPAGNSWIEFMGSMADPKWSLKTYDRSRDQDVLLGLVAPDDVDEGKTEKVRTIGEDEARKIEAGEKVDGDDDEEGEVCGYRDNEIKSGSAISEKGKKITLKVEDTEDLARDILKSENCGLEIPEIQLNEELGLNDMKVEGYEEDAEEAKAEA
ncbi:nucleolar zinc-finger protein [Tulasnella sp. UAMH 9824]|nr:nucleolar zinc-finger protein [Tulasnella sp. UAMH 9824]